MTSLLFAAALATYPHMLKVTDQTDSFACTGYIGQGVQCGAVTRKRDSYFDIHQGSCSDACAAAEGRCHAGETTMELLVGDCGYGQHTVVDWDVATQPPGSHCNGKTDFLFGLRREGCISNVTVRSRESNVTLHFLDIASSSLQANVLLNVSCPGIDTARLRDVVTCTAYSGHQGSRTSFTFFETSSSHNRILFYPTGSGSVSGDVWSPPGPSQYKLTFDYTLPAEAVTDLGVEYQVQYYSMGKWENHSVVAEQLSGHTPQPPVLLPTKGSRVQCANVDANTWRCAVEVRDDLGPVATQGDAWKAFKTEYTVEGCDAAEVEVGGYTVTGPAAYTFDFRKLGACAYKDVTVNVAVSVGGEVVSSGVQRVDAPGVKTPAPPTPPPTPTPTFPHKQKKSYDTLYIEFGCAALALLVIGFGFFIRLKYKEESTRAGTWALLGPGEGEYTVKVVFEEEGPSTAMTEYQVLQ